jgi:hypothetical protein
VEAGAEPPHLRHSPKNDFSHVMDSRK